MPQNRWGLLSLLLDGFLVSTELVSLRGRSRSILDARHELGDSPTFGLWVGVKNKLKRQLLFVTKASFS